MDESMRAKLATYFQQENLEVAETRLDEDDLFLGSFILGSLYQNLGVKIYFPDIGFSDAELATILVAAALTGVEAYRVHKERFPDAPKVFDDLDEAERPDLTGLSGLMGGLGK